MGFDVCGEVFVVEEALSIAGIADFIASWFGVGVFEEIVEFAGDVILDGSRVVMFLARPHRELNFLVDGVLPASC
ncbi:uncharacterized protein FPRO_06499 [Fusarium proliferatum ET1]|uniref:Uncharacterized protein n=1 Tax=Fusarium proliferatum (strain ET1) TaxID=1227346 RepID=A0A1L7VFP0_FUSPR|nr:uncharacterized protein FPRO_06499 [Fusarium proliferatum ET1]CZR38310.1 uncharacterized protein FPRO_06499 [Fusarium proliferatum ET1]